MDKLQVMLLLALVGLVLEGSTAELPKPSYARTMLKVSRSLPGETEELKVRTSEGNLATLIVKRRDKSVSSDNGKLEQNSTDVTQRSVDLPGSENVTETSDSSTSASEIKSKEEIRKLEDAQIEQLRSKLASESERSKNDEDTVKVSERKSIEGSTSDKDPASQGRIIDYGRWIPLSGDGRALNLEESTEDYQSWKPLPRDLRTGTEERTDYVRFSEPTLPSGSLLFARNFQDRSQRNVELNEQAVDRNTRFAFLPHQVRSSRTNVGANFSKNRDAKNVPPEVIVRSEINVKSAPKRAGLSLDRDGTPVISGKRVPDEPIDKIQTWRNARVINNKLVQDGAATVNLEPSSTFYPADIPAERQRFDKFFKNVNRRYGRNFDEDGRNVYFEWDPNNYKSEALKAEIYESRSDSYRSNLHKRMLHPNGITSYPSSQLYTPESQKIAPVPLKPGARAPVLQYAHPELGVQPAKIVKNEKRRPDNFPESQHSFTEQRQKKKYVLNDKNIIDTYTTKNYYPNQYFYGLKRPSDTPFWVKISENLKNHFSTGVERVSEFTRPVIDPLVEATHKISQNLGLSRGKEAQDKVGTVTSGASMLIPALGLVASGAALGIGAVAVGRYLDVDVLKRSNDGSNIELNRQRALEASEPFLRKVEASRQTDAEGNLFEQPGAVYILEDIPQEQNSGNSYRSSEGNQDSVVLVLEENDKSAERMNTNESEPVTTQESSTEGKLRKRRSLNYLDILKADEQMKNLARSKRFQRKGADPISEIVEIDLPTRDGNIQVTELLIPKMKSSEEKNVQDSSKNDAIFIIEDGELMPSDSMEMNLEGQVTNQDSLNDITKMVKDAMEKSTETSAMNTVDGRSERRKRSVQDDQELDDVLQNLENAEIAEVAHIDGDWTNTPCAKRIFCDAMVQRGPDAAIFMEKKMSALLGLIQSSAAIQVSSHFNEVMDAVRRHDCSRFTCSQARPGNVFF